jgi:hypothetical protein
MYETWEEINKIMNFKQNANFYKRDGYWLSIRKPGDRYINTKIEFKDTFYKRQLGIYKLPFNPEKPKALHVPERESNNRYNSLYGQIHYISDLIRSLGKGVYIIYSCRQIAKTFFRENNKNTQAHYHGLKYKTPNRFSIQTSKNYKKIHNHNNRVVSYLRNLEQRQDVIRNHDVIPTKTLLDVEKLIDKSNREPVNNNQNINKLITNFNRMHINQKSKATLFYNFIQNMKSLNKQRIKHILSFLTPNELHNVYIKAESETNNARVEKSNIIMNYIGPLITAPHRSLLGK